jgi:rhodanese-related sulfurtransferase
MLLVTTFVTILEAQSVVSEKTVVTSDELINPTFTREYSNITVQQAWEFLTNTSNGIQIPIDVRYDYEWVAAHIDTPYPENPHHWPNLQNGEKLSEFLDKYQGKEIILYCKAGSRSKAAATLLVQHNFDGVIYNMLGGIDAWILAGYPTKANSPPEIPIITGETNGKAGTEYQYTFNTTDLDYDVVSYYVNWSDTTPDELTGPHPSGEAVTLSHTWAEKGTYTIKAKAIDRYNEESDWATLTITMPCIYTKSTLQFLEMLFLRFPTAFLLLRYLLRY